MQLTVVTPTGNVAPDEGEQVVVTWQLSVAVGAGNVTIAEAPLVATVVTAVGQTMVGGCVSLTVSKNVNREGASVSQMIA